MATETNIPHAVVSLMLEHDKTPIQAWREYLKLTPESVAAKLGMTPEAYVELEKATTVHHPTLHRVSAALGITFEQLDL